MAVTTTLNDSFGSHATAVGLGFLLNDEMDDFASKQGVPNMYGLIQGPNAAIAPGHRPLSSMTPTILLKDGQVRFVIGSPGGLAHHHNGREHPARRPARFGGWGRPEHPAGSGCAALSSPISA